jgi:hypothetical protein
MLQEGQARGGLEIPIGFRDMEVIVDLSKNDYSSVMGTSHLPTEYVDWEREIEVQLVYKSKCR